MEKINDLVAVNEKLRQLLEDKNSNEIARMSGTHQPTIYQWKEQGKDLRFEQLRKIAEICRPLELNAVLMNKSIGAMSFIDLSIDNEKESLILSSEMLSRENTELREKITPLKNKIAVLREKLNRKSGIISHDIDGLIEVVKLITGYDNLGEDKSIKRLKFLLKEAEIPYVIYKIEGLDRYILGYDLGIIVE